MFQLCMVPYAPQGTSFDMHSIEDAIEDQLSHVSVACRDTLFDCLGTLNPVHLHQTAFLSALLVRNW